MKLSEILRKLEDLKVRRNSYIYDTFLDMCGLPYNRSLYDRRTGLVSPTTPGRKNLNEAMLYAIKKSGVKARAFHIGRKPSDLRIQFDPIETDLTIDEIKSQIYLQLDK